jgi:hypothetical protein
MRFVRTVGRYEFDAAYVETRFQFTNCGPAIGPHTELSYLVLRAGAILSRQPKSEFARSVLP